MKTLLSSRKLLCIQVQKHLSSPWENVFMVFYIMMNDKFVTDDSRHSNRFIQGRERENDMHFEKPQHYVCRKLYDIIFTDYMKITKIYNKWTYRHSILHALIINTSKIIAIFFNAFKRLTFSDFALFCYFIFIYA